MYFDRDILLLLYQITSLLNMVKILIIYLLLFFSPTLYAQNDSLQKQYNTIETLFEKKDSLVKVKQLYMLQLKDSLQLFQKQKNYENEYRILSDITKEYESFVYDSAYHYGSKTIKLAYRLGDQQKIAEAKTNLSLILLLKGLFKETIDTLQAINPTVLDRQGKIDFYSVSYRAYYDMSNSRWGDYHELYRKKGHEYCEKLFAIADPDSYAYSLGKALNSLAKNKSHDAIYFYSKMLRELDLDDHQKAIAYCGLEISNWRLKKIAEAKYYGTQAVISDLKSITKETVAAKVLAEILFEEGNIELASKYIKEADEDAKFYGSNVRKLEIAYVQPFIEKAMLLKVEKEKNRMFYIAIVIFALALLLILFSFIIYRQLGELRKARREILDKNRDLEVVNTMLREVSRIKEEYVGYYFSFSSMILEKMEGMKKTISRQLLTKQYEGIEGELKKYNAKKERKLLFEDFDRIFLKLFPDFVNRFNALFEKENQIEPKDEKSLTTDLRIFALIRLGITDNEKIAHILNFSVNTIYTYKTRIKNKSIVSNEEFEEKIMNIKSV